MSTKIYNGMILRNGTLEQALAKLKAVRKQCIAPMQLAVAREVCKRLVHYKDIEMNLCSIDQKNRDFWTVQGAVREAEINTQGKGERDTTWDYTFEVCLIPFGTDLLVLHYIENNPGYLDALKAAGIEDYHYQNQTDRPESIGAEDWARRQVDWKEALPGCTSPSQVGVSYRVIGWGDIKEVLWMRDLVVAQLPSEEKRRKRVAVRLTELEVGRNSPDLGLSALVDMVYELEVYRRDSVILCAEPF